MAERFLKKTRFEFVSGKLSWVRVVKPDLTYNCWTVTLHPDATSLEKIREWQGEGLKNQIKKDEDGWYVKFRCNVSRERKDGTIWTFEPPKVVDKDGRPFDGTTIGNGSDGTVKLEVYEHGTPGGGRAIAARLVGVKVDNLVPFNPESDYTEQEAEATKDLRSQPEVWG